MTMIASTRFAAIAFAPVSPETAVLDSLHMNPVVIDDERLADANARELLLDRAFGPARLRKTCQRLRAGRLPARGLSLVARASHGGAGASDILGTVRLWHVDAGGVDALMLGPLAVDACQRCSGIGARLMTEAISRARALGHAAVLLVGDAPYYARFGFERRHTLSLRMPGPVDEARFLGLELVTGALAPADGSVHPTGAPDLGGRYSARRSKMREAA